MPGEENEERERRHAAGLAAAAALDARLAAARAAAAATEKLRKLRENTLYEIKRKGTRYLETPQGRLNERKIETLDNAITKLREEIGSRRLKLDIKDTGLTKNGRETILKEIQERKGEIDKLNKERIAFIEKIRKGIQSAANFRNLAKKALEITAGVRSKNFHPEVVPSIFGDSPIAVAPWLNNLRKKGYTDPLFDATQNYCLSKKSPTESMKNWFITLCTAGEVDVRDTRNMTPLILVSEPGNIECMETLLLNGADPNAKNNDGNTPLMYAATKPVLYEKKGKTETEAEMAVMLLLNDIPGRAEYTKKVADPNVQNNTGLTALMQAAKSGFERVVEILVKANADPNLQEENGNTALIYAAKEGYIGIVEFLLNNGAEINKKGKYEITALMRAAERSDEAMLNLLLKKGADINAKDSRGYTALIHAVERNDEAMLKLLLDNRADINAKGKDEITALIHAAETSDEAILKLLLDNGADINAKDSRGYTALIAGAHRHRLYLIPRTINIVDMVEMLLKKRANINEKDNKGNTALDYVTTNTEMKNLLLAYGAKSGREPVVEEEPSPASLAPAPRHPTGCLPGSSCAIMGGRVKHTRRRFRKRRRRTFKRAK